MLLAVPNLSEGADAQLIATLAGAFVAEAELLDTHSDEVHGRTVFTLASEPAALRRSLLAGAAAAIETIDLHEHAGTHPRIGALDVCPLVYLDLEERGPAEAHARELADELGDLGLPVFLYGALATTEARVERNFFRRGGLDSLAARLDSGELEPDFGPAQLHPTAGAVLVTARAPLAAFNVELEGISIDAGREIAARLRESGGGMPGVRAIAIALSSDRIQISTNVHDPLAVPLGDVVREIDRLAAPLGGRATAAELVGLIPRGALADYPDEVPIRDFDPDQRTIEARLGL